MRFALIITNQAFIIYMTTYDEILHFYKIMNIEY